MPFSVSANAVYFKLSSAVAEKPQPAPSSYCQRILWKVTLRADEMFQAYGTHGSCWERLRTSRSKAIFNVKQGCIPEFLCVVIGWIYWMMSVKPRYDRGTSCSRLRRQCSSLITFWCELRCIKCAMTPNCCGKNCSLMLSRATHPWILLIAPRRLSAHVR